MKIIAFGHRRSVGKDTLARLMMTYLRSHHANVKVVRVSFASKLKQLSHDLYSWAGLYTETYYENNPAAKEDVLPALGKSARDIWIELGNSCRSIYDLTWIKLAIKTISPNADIAIFSDLRYQNEADEIKKVGGRCLHLVRPDQPKFDDIADSALDTYTGWDDVILNNGSVKDLGTIAKSLALSLL